MKTRELMADDFEVGMYFTVAAKEGEEEGREQDGMFPMAMMFSGAPYGYRLRGHVLQIKAINLPYLACECLSAKDSVGIVFDIDTSRVRLLRLNEEYVSARRLPPPPRPWWKFWGA